jgi:hypothetical protein
MPSRFGLWPPLLHIIRPIISKQKAAVRIIANKRYNDHSEPLFKQLSILPLKDLINLFNLKLFHSFVFYSIPVAFQNTWTTNREHRNYDNNDNIALRDDDDYHIPHYRTDYISKFPLCNLPRTWNMFSSDLVSTPNRSKFTYGATVFLLDKLSETPSCNRLLRPYCLMNNIGQLP